MALKSPAQKIMSSLAMFKFSRTELRFMRDEAVNWEELSKQIMEGTNCIPIGKTKSDYAKVIEAIRLAACGYHVEIMGQALEEYISEKNLSNIASLYELEKYLFLLRCALLHTEGELLAKWQFNRNNPTKKEINAIKKLQAGGLKIKIPVIKVEGKDDCYDEKSEIYKKLTFKVYLKKNNNNGTTHPIVRLNEGLIYKLMLLSDHVCTITKKKNPSTLLKYLNRTTVKERTI